MIIQDRFIGNVKILELYDSIMSHPAMDAAELSSKISASENVMVLMENISKVNGIKFIEEMDSILRERRAAIVSQRESLDPCFQGRAYPCFRDLIEAAFYYEKAMAEGDAVDTEYADKRKGARLKKIIPVEMKLTRDVEPRVSIHGVTKNLSEYGAFIQIVSSNSELLVRKLLDPYDLKMLDIKFYAGPDRFYELKGKVVHRNDQLYSMGIEFFEVSESTKQFLNRILQIRS